MTSEPRTPGFDPTTEASVLVDRLVGCLVGSRIYEMFRAREFLYHRYAYRRR